nr:unnamed protein product [Callosobruchus analis]
MNGVLCTEDSIPIKACSAPDPPDGANGVSVSLMYGSEPGARATICNEKRVEHSFRKGRIWDKRDRCIYCSLDVTNFSRHLFRKHSQEASVKNILQLPKGDSNRKKMIDLLRNDGNLSILEENIVRPVQRPTCSKGNTPSSNDFLPCKYCKGLYKSNSLKRHAKRCAFNSEKRNGIRYKSEGQSMVAFLASRKPYLDKMRLKSEVFNTMQADRISYNGKSDPIICQYAEDYLRKHRRPHIKHAVSNRYVN